MKIKIIYGCPIAGNLKETFEKNQSKHEDYIGIFLGEVKVKEENSTIFYSRLDLASITPGLLTPGLNRMPLSATEEEKEEVLQKVNRLPNSLRNMLPPIGVYFIYSIGKRTKL